MTEMGQSDTSSNTTEARAGALAQRSLDDGRELVVYPTIFTTRLCLGPAGEPWYDDAWCYENRLDCLVACAEWDGAGDPPGRWIRNIGSARRREYDSEGQVVREWVAP